jgi:N6-adenosine-specific RNA methylase IME4
MDLINYSKARFEKNSLVISEDITIDEWKQLGQSLKQVEGSVQFWIGDWARYGDKRGFTGKYTDPKVYDELEEITGFSRGTIQNFKSVADRTSSSRDEDLSFRHHMEVAKLEPEKQSEFLQKAKSENLSAKDLRREITYSEKEFEASALPHGTYSVIYADPPWSYSNSGFAMSAASHYPTMPTDDIAAMDIDGISADNAVCFMWVTNPLLEDGLTVLNAWGFDYKTNMVWVKKSHTAGFYIYGQHELLLIGVRGSMLPHGDKKKSIITGDNSVHSKKPDSVRLMIEEMYPNQKYLELFARQKTENWEVFGNEV